MQDFDVVVLHNGLREIDEKVRAGQLNAEEAEVARRSLEDKLNVVSGKIEFQKLCEMVESGDMTLVLENGDTVTLGDANGVVKRFVEEEKKKAERAFKFLDCLDDAIRAGAIMDFVMPNNKKFGDCSDRELGEFGIYRDIVERAVAAARANDSHLDARAVQDWLGQGLCVFGRELYFGVAGTAQIVAHGLAAVE
jgi:hypothetical protein